MPSRYKPHQKKKNLSTKWALVLVSVLVVIAAASWFFIQPSNSSTNIDGTAQNNVKTSQESTEGQPKEDETVEEQEETKPVEETAAPEQTEEAAQEKAKQAETSKEETSKEETPKEETPEEESQKEPVSETDAKDQVSTGNAAVYSEAIELPKEPTVINGILLANKQHPLPETYAPGEAKEARSAFEEMRAQALQEGVDLVAFSTYRDFARQKELYSGYVAKDGQEAADRYSARPGYSEHQTGLAFDIGEAGQEQHWASATFGDTKGGKWLAKNAHMYGFILRYPEGSESITGYMHESWHFRYVGKKAASEIHKKGITLEQYLGV